MKLRIGQNPPETGQILPSLATSIATNQRYDLCTGTIKTNANHQASPEIMLKEKKNSASTYRKASFFLALHLPFFGTFFSVIHIFRYSA
jgi:hypothetical protein